MSGEEAGPPPPSEETGRRLPLPAWVALVIALTGLFLALGRALG